MSYGKPCQFKGCGDYISDEDMPFCHYHAEQLLPKFELYDLNGLNPKSRIFSKRRKPQAHGGQEA